MATQKASAKIIRDYTPGGNQEFLRYAQDDLSAINLNKEGASADGLRALDKSRNELRTWLADRKTDITASTSRHQGTLNRLEKLIEKPKAALDSTTKLTEQLTEVEKAINANDLTKIKDALGKVSAPEKGFHGIASATAPTALTYGTTTFQPTDALKGNIGLAKDAHAEVVTQAGKLDEALKTLKGKLNGQDKLSPEIVTELKTELGKANEAVKPVHEAAQGAVSRVHKAIDRKAKTAVDVLTGQKKECISEGVFVSKPKEISDKISGFKKDFDGLVDPKKVPGSHLEAQAKAGSVGKAAGKAGDGWVSRLKLPEIKQTWNKSSTAMKFGRVAGASVGVVAVYDGLSRSKNAEGQDRSALGRLAEVAAGVGAIGVSAAGFRR